MEGTTLPFKASLLLMLVNTISCTDRFVLVGGSIKLPLPEPLPVGTKITSIIWKHNRDKAAEYFEGDDSSIYFHIFKNVANLDMNTWALTISNLQSEFNGRYSAEVNNKDLAQFVTLHVLPAVSKPKISMECIEDNCTLTCKGTEDGGFTKYTWSDDKESKGTGPVLTVMKEDKDVTYTCNFSNPVSSQTSRWTVPKKKTHLTALAVGLSFAFLALAGGAGYVSNKKYNWVGKIGMKGNTGKDPGVEAGASAQDQSKGTDQHVANANGSNTQDNSQQQPSSTGRTGEDPGVAAGAGLPSAEDQSEGTEATELTRLMPPNNSDSAKVVNENNTADSKNEEGSPPSNNQGEDPGVEAEAGSPSAKDQAEDQNGVNDGITPGSSQPPLPNSIGEGSPGSSHKGNASEAPADQMASA